MLRRLLIAGNWKMNKTIKEAIELVTELRREVYNIDALDIAVCPPFTALSSVQEVLNNSNIAIGAQDMYFEEEGAFTGEVSAAMLLDVGCRFVIVGHSERRKVIGETDDLINKKVKAVVQAGLLPILCIGETLEERQQNKTFDIIKRQLTHDLNEIDNDQIQKVVIAYEPVWAIGTGKNATSAQAQEAHAFIRKCLCHKYGDEAAQAIRILYGGSVKPDNAAELTAQADVDGALVGGASLTAESFTQIIKESIK